MSTDVCSFCKDDPVVETLAMHDDAGDVPVCAYCLHCVNTHGAGELARQAAGERLAEFTDDKLLLMTHRNYLARSY
jgi:hypothetical protein